MNTVTGRHFIRKVSNGQYVITRVFVLGHLSRFKLPLRNEDGYPHTATRLAYTPLGTLSVPKYSWQVHMKKVAA